MNSTYSSRVAVLLKPAMNPHTAMEGMDSDTVTTDVESLRGDEIDESTLEQHVVCKDEEDLDLSQQILGVLVVFSPSILLALSMLLVVVLRDSR